MSIDMVENYTLSRLRAMKKEQILVVTDAYHFPLLNAHFHVNNTSHYSEQMILVIRIMHLIKISTSLVD